MNERLTSFIVLNSSDIENKMLSRHVYHKRNVAEDGQTMFRKKAVWQNQMISNNWNLMEKCSSLLF